MVGILLVSHGDFAEAMLRSCKFIVGETEKASALGLMPGDDVNDLQRKIKEKIEQLDDGSGVLIMVDIIGGSPYNRALWSVMEKKHSCKCITGMSMPMLLNALEIRNGETLEVLTQACVDCSDQYIKTFGIDDLNKPFKQKG